MKEQLIINYLLSNDEYFRTVLSHVKREFFSNMGCKIIFGMIEDYYNEYGKLPTKDVIEVNVSEIDYLKERDFEECERICSEIEYNCSFDIKWAIDKTEDYCKNRAIYNAIMDSIKIFNGDDKEQNITAIPGLLEEALSTKFIKNIGHNYIDDADKRIDEYGQAVEKILFDLDIFNQATNGGLERKTLNMFMGHTGIGKTLVMCHLAASWFAMGYNVLYISMEMAENKISQRIDANLLNIDLNDLLTFNKIKLKQRINKIKQKTPGKLIVKEFPTSGASVTHFKHLLEELRLTNNFVPDIILIDYLNICSSSRLKASALSNPYLYYKTVAEEIRALAVSTNTCIVSATQTNRGGFNNSDIDMDDTSDSFGLPMTLDLMWALITSDELRAVNQIMIKQLKSRYDDKDSLLRFVIGVDKPHMRLYDCEQSAQDDILDDKPLMDKTSFGMSMQNENFGKKKRRKKDVESMGEFLNNV